MTDFLDEITRKEEKSGRFRLVYIPVIIAMLAVFVGFVMVYAQAGEKLAERKALCARDRIITHTTVFIVDPSDDLSELHKQRAWATLQEAIKTTPSGGQFIIATLETEKTEKPASKSGKVPAKIRYRANPTIHAVLCHPGTAQKASGFSADVKTLKRIFDKRFVEPAQIAFEQAVKPDGDDWSPIIETIFVLQQRPDFDLRVQERRLDLPCFNGETF